MKPERETDRTLNWIIILGLAISFSSIIATLEALRGTPTGLKFSITWRTFFALFIGAAVTIPCFRLIVLSERKSLRRVALCLVVLIGISGFFYPLRFVPREKMRDIFIGLGFAAIALSGV